jgi:catechol 2,3-dioxygenase-like lactoylglutathione lyase family enzyme
MPFEPNSLSVILLLAEDANQTAGFYRDTLGIEFVEEKHDTRRSHFGARLGSVYFTIQWACDFPGPEFTRGGNSMQLAFTTADMNAFLAHLQAQGITPLHAPTRFDQVLFTTLQDPDGRFVQVMTPWRE